VDAHPHACGAGTAQQAGVSRGGWAGMGGAQAWGQPGERGGK
jgi:hypothetical protein